jgi:hypothetical protein
MPPTARAAATMLWRRPGQDTVCSTIWRSLPTG